MRDFDQHISVFGISTVFHDFDCTVATGFRPLRHESPDTFRDSRPIHTFERAGSREAETPNLRAGGLIRYTLIVLESNLSKKDAARFTIHASDYYAASFKIQEFDFAGISAGQNTIHKTQINKTQQNISKKQNKKLRLYEFQGNSTDFSRCWRLGLLISKSQGLFDPDC